MTRTYCTILSSNYLPKALALAESVRRDTDRLYPLRRDVAVAIQRSPAHPLDRAWFA